MQDCQDLLFPKSKSLFMDILHQCTHDLQYLSLISEIKIKER